MKIPMIALIVAAVLPVSLAQIPNDECASLSQTDCAQLVKQYATKAVKQLKNELPDPTSLAILSMSAGSYLETQKHAAGNHIRGDRVFRGCIHFVAANSAGAKRQECGGYYTRIIRKTGQTKIDTYFFPSYDAQFQSATPCACEPRPGFVDFTEEAKAAIGPEEASRASSPPVATDPQVVTVGPTPATGKLSVASVPDGADIEIDGTFVGNTPSDLQVPEGDHVIAVKKPGFKNWERKLKVSAGSTVRLNAELEAPVR
jgi:hypothetical protein